jgi:hypothetical protein
LYAKFPNMPMQLFIAASPYPLAVMQPTGARFPAADGETSC